MGICPRTAVNMGTVLVSHTHVDHVAAIVHHAASRNLLGMKPATYFVPRENEAGIRSLFDSFEQLDGTKHEYDLVPCGPGEDLDIGKNLRIRPFFSPHRVPAQGYAIVSVRSKLAPELAGTPPDEIARLKAKGLDVTRTNEVVEVAFTGDTRIEVLEEEAVRKARLLIMELTFVGDEVDVQGARDRGHVHVDEIAERADLFENEAILFMHFSARHHPEEIVRALDKRLPKKLRERVTPLLTERG